MSGEILRPSSVTEKAPEWSGRSISASKAHTHKALKAALMPRLGISYLLARLIIPPSAVARERRHHGWASQIGLSTERERPDKERLGGRVKEEGKGESFFV